MYEEFKVKKINRAGKEQRRKFGVGFDQLEGKLVITNDKMDNSTKFRDVTNRVRYIRDILEIQIDSDDPRKFKIVWDEEGYSPGDYELSYIMILDDQTEKEKLRAETDVKRIVSKVQYLLENFFPGRKESRELRKKPSISEKKGSLSNGNSSGNLQHTKSGFGSMWHGHGPPRGVHFS